MENKLRRGYFCYHVPCSSSFFEEVISELLELHQGGGPFAAGSLGRVEYNLGYADLEHLHDTGGVITISREPFVQKVEFFNGTAHIVMEWCMSPVSSEDSNDSLSLGHGWLIDEEEEEEEEGEQAHGAEEEEVMFFSSGASEVNEESSAEEEDVEVIPDQSGQSSDDEEDVEVITDQDSPLGSAPR